MIVIRATQKFVQFFTWLDVLITVLRRVYGLKINKWSHLEFWKSTQGYREAITTRKMYVWGVLWSGQMIWPGLSSQQRVTIKGGKYTVIITNVFVPQMDDMDEAEMKLQQKDGTSHTIRETMLKMFLHITTYPKKLYRITVHHSIRQHMLLPKKCYNEPILKDLVSLSSKTTS